MKTKVMILTCLLVGLVIIGFGGFAQAAYIGGSQILPSTDLVAESYFTINTIADGISTDYPYNGFASLVDVDHGVIKLALDKNYDLTSFTLWNDINVAQEGIKDFKLNFYSSTNSLISTSEFTAPIGQLAPTTYNLGLIRGVSYVNLDVINCNADNYFNRIEIREVAFNGTPTPIPAAILLFGSGLVGLIGIKFSRKNWRLGSE